MTLGQFIASLPHGERGTFRQRLAALHGVSVETIRKWENYPAPSGWTETQRAQRSRPHPAELESVALTEQVTGGEVTRHDLRPEIFGQQQLEG